MRNLPLIIPQLYESREEILQITILMPFACGNNPSKVESTEKSCGYKRLTKQVTVGCITCTEALVHVGFKKFLPDDSPSHPGI